MGAERETKRDMFSVKLFFLVLGAIVAYNLNDWLEGEPEWERLAYDPGAFAVQTAGKPDLRKMREDLPFGTVEFQYLMFERGDVQYAIAYGDIPAGVGPDSAMAAAHDAIVAKMDGEILAAAEVDMADRSARQTRIQAADESLVQIQSLLVNRRLYNLMAGGAPYAFDANPDIMHFFSSFELLNPP
mgnify:FL=1